MKIIRTLAAEDCPNGVDCAKVHELEDGNLLVRGYRTDGSATDAHTTALPERTVRIPAQVRADAGTALRASALTELRDGSYLVRGAPITRTEHAALRLPDHEDAVRITTRKDPA